MELAVHMIQRARSRLVRHSDFDRLPTKDPVQSMTRSDVEPGGIRLLGAMIVIRGRGNWQYLADGLDPLSELAVLALQRLQLLGHSGGKPGMLAAVDSAFLTQSSSVCAEQPVLAEIDWQAVQREG